MKVTPTALPEVLLIEPRIFTDARGSFFESFNEARYREIGIEVAFVQDNVSHSLRGVLRGLHLQQPNAQGKLISVLDGEIFDVAVDLRVGSPRFAQWTSATLSAKNGLQLWIPPGFAHGFFVPSASALVAYKCTAYYEPASELCIRWNDPRLGVTWPTTEVTLSGKDREGLPLDAIDQSRLARYDG